MEGGGSCRASERSRGRRVQSKFQDGGGCCSRDSPSRAGSVPRSIAVTPGARARVSLALFKAPFSPPNWWCWWPDAGGVGGASLHEGKLLREAGAPWLLRGLLPAPPDCVCFAPDSSPPPTASHKSSLLGVWLGTSAWAGRVRRDGEGVGSPGALGAAAQSVAGGARRGERPGAGISALGQGSASVVVASPRGSVPAGALGGFRAFRRSRGWKASGSQCAFRCPGAGPASERVQRDGCYSAAPATSRDGSGDLPARPPPSCSPPAGRFHALSRC